MLVVGPVVGLNVAVLQVAQSGDGELRTLTDDFGTSVVLHAHGGLTLRQLMELVDKDVLKVVHLCLVLIINLCQYLLVLQLVLACLDGTCKHLLVDDDTRE